MKVVGKPSIFQAIQSLMPDASFYVENDCFEGICWEDERNQPMRSEIEAKLVELQADYDSKQYQRDRLQEYPSIQELVVALYDEEDKASIIEKRNAVKAKYPKPE